MRRISCERPDLARAAATGVKSRANHRSSAASDAGRIGPFGGRRQAAARQSYRDAGVGVIATAARSAPDSRRARGCARRPAASTVTTATQPVPKVTARAVSPAGSAMLGGQRRAPAPGDSAERRMTSRPTTVMTPRISVAVSSVTSRRRCAQAAGLGPILVRRPVRPPEVEPVMSAPFQILSITLPAGPAERLDKALAAAAPDGLGLSRSRLQALILEGAVRRAGGAPIVDPRFRVARRRGDRGDPAAADAVARRGRGHPARRGLRGRRPDRDRQARRASSCIRRPARRDGTLVNALLHHCGDSLSGVGGEVRPGIVHRIDKDTSGLLVAAKNDAAHQGLAAQFAAHTLERRYLAVTWGAPDAADPRLAGLDGVAWEPDGVLQDRDADRAQHDRPQAHGGGARGRAHGGDAGPDARAVRRPGAARARRWSSAGSRPGAPTRSACISPMSGIRWSATASTAAGGSGPIRRWRAFRGRRCTRPRSASCIRASGAAMRFDSPLAGRFRGFARRRIATER